MSVIQPPALTKFPGAVINGLGDSIIAAQSQYFPVNASFTAPAWQASTAYVVGQCVLNGGNLYRCTVAGTSAASGGPSGFSTSSIADNTVTWVFYNFQSNKGGTSFLQWAEKFSLGRLNFDQAQGYAGPNASVLKVITVNGGSNYAGGDTVTFNQGAAGTLNVSGGVITGVTITNPGYGTSAFTLTVNTSTGAGAVLSLVTGGSGTFGVTGALTSDMVARLPDILVSSAEIVVVHGGTNDVSGGTPYATITANLRTCYEALAAAGRKVIAVPVLPRTGLTNAKTAVLLRVNRWIRAYCNKESWANPLGINNVVLADPSGYFTDGTSLTYQPVGGSGGTAGAMTQDGIHPSARGAMYMGYAVWQAAQQFLGQSSNYAPRCYGMYDGYDPNQNPGGNYLEAYPWQVSTTYALGQLCANSNNIYRCTQAGTSASSGGPSGIGTNITDNTAKWNFLYPQGMSVLKGTTGTSSAATGITFSGTFPSGYTIQRNSGTASGTITGSTENPWSNGQAGQRAVLQFSLGGGGVKEIWWLTAFFNTYATAGVLAGDLNSALFIAEAELELSSVANLTGVYVQLSDNTTNWSVTDGSNATGAGAHMLASSGEMIAYPNNGKLYLKTQPMLLPSNLTGFDFNLVFAFDTSGAAGSATATAKINYMGVRKVGVG